MARFKYHTGIVSVRDNTPALQTMTIDQLNDLGIAEPCEMRVVKPPSFPEGISPQMSGFWNAMSKRKHFRISRKK